MLELRSQLQEKKNALMRQVEEERRRLASLEQESAQVNYKLVMVDGPVIGKAGDCLDWIAGGLEIKNSKI